MKHSLSKNLSLPKTLLLLLLGFPLLASVACTGAPAATTTPSMAAGVEATTDLYPETSDAVHWARNSAEHRADFLQTFRLAGELVAVLAEDHEPGTWGVITDADETIIDNTPFQILLEERGITWDPKLWAEWVERRESTALPGSRAFLDQVRDLGGFIGVVTNRRTPLCPATVDTLRRQKLEFDVVLCQDPDGDGDKSPRWESLEEGTASVDLPPFRVLMYLGDNIHDFPDMEQEDRFGPASRFERFGTTYVILPNPMYGSWTDNPKR